MPQELVDKLAIAGVAFIVAVLTIAPSFLKAWSKRSESRADTKDKIDTANYKIVLNLANKALSLTQQNISLLQQHSTDQERITNQQHQIDALTEELLNVRRELGKIQVQAMGFEVELNEQRGETTKPLKSDIINKEDPRWNSLSDRL